MSVTRAQIIIFVSILMVGTGVYLSNKGKDGSDGNQNTKWGKILIWTGSIILVLTSVLAYRIVPKS